MNKKQHGHRREYRFHARSPMTSRGANTIAHATIPSRLTVQYTAHNEQKCSCDAI